MRVKHDIIKLDYKDTKDFFEKRAITYSEEHPYTTTMYQDKHVELAKKRNEIEQEKILPLLELAENSAVLDIACGIGRWADAMREDIAYYLGVDFSEGLIEIAKKRNVREQFHFVQGAVNQLGTVCNEQKSPAFNRIIVAGILVYLNDEDVLGLFKNIAELAGKEAILYIREPVGTVDRLTLKKFYSEELDSEYHAVYRTKEEYETLMAQTLFRAGFSIVKGGALFEESTNLNNRKETMQYFYILKRNGEEALCQFPEQSL